MQTGGVKGTRSLMVIMLMMLAGSEGRGTEGAEMLRSRATAEIRREEGPPRGTGHD